MDERPMDHRGETATPLVAAERIEKEIGLAWLRGLVCTVTVSDYEMMAICRTLRHQAEEIERLVRGLEQLRNSSLFDPYARMAADATLHPRRTESEPR